MSDMQAESAAPQQAESLAPAHQPSSADSIPQGNLPQGNSEAAPAPVDDMPWLMRDKFKGNTVDEIVQKQAQAYPELFQKMGKYWGAPKETDYDVSALNEYGIAPDDPILDTLKPVLKEIGISNEGLKKLASGWGDALTNMSRKMTEEMQKKMTPSDVQNVQVVDSWLNEQFTGEERERIKSWLADPEDFRILNTMRTLIPRNSNVPNSPTSLGASHESVYQIEQEKLANFQKYKTDNAYRADLTRRERDAREREMRYNKR